LAATEAEALAGIRQVVAEYVADLIEDGTDAHSTSRALTLENFFPWDATFTWV
jgi:predicted RNase H-like HicB family nuclease